MQVEYATDLAFRSTTTLHPLYKQLIHETILNVKTKQINNFLYPQITPLLTQKIHSQFSTLIKKNYVKQHFNKYSIKIYNKCNITLHIKNNNNTYPSSNNTKNKTSPPPAEREVAPVKKTIYSLIDLRELLLCCNHTTSPTCRP